VKFKVILFVLGYWLTGTAGSFFFRHGGVHPEVFKLCYILGNVMGITSTCFLMKTYGVMKNVNVATVLTGAGAFVIFQILLWVLYRAPLSPLCITGLVMMCIGIVLTVWKKEPEKIEEKGDAKC